ncbi:MAG TPA: porin [Microscillaceae bacterium]|nr:porin [Microscillaceae bacterium]
MDTTDIDIKGKLSINGYVDAYYAYDLSNPRNNERPYFVSMARHNEFTVNLAYLDIRYSASRVRARFVPGFGTYINANYVTEPGALKNIIEGYAGFRPFANKQIWIDMGVFGSPYTNESAISKDHLVYTRSFAPEYVPYYLSGIKVSIPINAKWAAYLYVLNGWQLIQDNNADKSIGTQVEFRPGNRWLINWNTYVGNEQSAARPTFRNRYFSDLFVIYNPAGRFSATACAYLGIQENVDTLTNNVQNRTWWTANLMGRYKLSDQHSVSGRVEYFEDLEGVQIAPITTTQTGFTGFNSSSASLCYNYAANNNMLFRVEARHFFSPRNMYLDERLNPANSSTMLITNITVWF